MLTRNKMIQVQNRGQGGVGYTIPDMNNLHRDFQPNEIKTITYEELFKLAQVPGGAYILQNYLIIKDEEVVKALFEEVEPEYNYTDEDVKRLMLKGSLDEFEDCLNFAPVGVIELIKNLAVSLPLNDIGKRDLILKKTGFSVSSAIELAKTDEVVEEEKPKRKAATPTSKTPTRKVVKPESK